MTTCTVEHYRDPDRPRGTADGFTICGGCDKGLERDLSALPKLYEDLAHLHTARRHGGQQKISGSSTARLPIDVMVADARSEIRATVVDWTTYAIQQARAVNAAGAQRLLALDTRTGAGWLNFNRDWCARQEWAPDMVTALRKVRSRAVRLLDPRRNQVFEIPGNFGYCVRQLDNTPCPGRMWVTMPHDETQPCVITCDTCGHIYPTMSWYRLGEMVRARSAA